MQFLQFGDQIFHAALVRVPRTLFPRHPVQGQLSVPEYHTKVHFFYLMEALIEDQKADYDTDYTQDLYIANMNDTELLMDEVDKDQTSTEADRKKLYKEGSFIGTIARHADRILGSRSTFHASSPDATTTRPLPGGRNDRPFNRDRNQKRSLCGRSFRSRSTPTVQTNSLADDFDDVNMTDADSIWDHCVNGLEYDLPPDNDPAMIYFADAVRNVAKDMN